MSINESLFQEQYQTNPDIRKIFHWKNSTRCYYNMIHVKHEMYRSKKILVCVEDFS